MSPEFPFLIPLEKDGSVSAWEKLDSGPLPKFGPVSGGRVPVGLVPASRTPPTPWVTRLPSVPGALQSQLDTHLTFSPHQPGVRFMVPKLYIVWGAILENEQQLANTQIRYKNMFI